MVNNKLHGVSGGECGVAGDEGGHWWIAGRKLVTIVPVRRREIACQIGGGDR